MCSWSIQSLTCLVVLCSLVSPSLQLEPDPAQLLKIGEPHSGFPAYKCPAGVGTEFVDWQADGIFQFADRLANTALQPQVLNKVIDFAAALLPSLLDPGSF